MIDQYELLLQLGDHSDALETQSRNHWLHCSRCSMKQTCEIGQHLDQTAYQAFKAWDELDTQLNFPELVKKNGAA